MMDGITIRDMTIEDYDGVYTLWMTIKGFAIRSIDDAREGVERFLSRNPGISVVAVKDGEIVGSILCGHDGRRDAFTMCASVRTAGCRESEKAWWCIVWTP